MADEWTWLHGLGSRWGQPRQHRALHQAVSSRQSDRADLGSPGAPNFRDDPAELRPERVVASEGIRTFEAFAMDS